MFLKIYWFGGYPFITFIFITVIVVNYLNYKGKLDIIENEKQQLSGQNQELKISLGDTQKSFMASKENLNAEITEMKALLNQKEKQLKELPKLDDPEISRLQKKGFSDPVNKITEDLKKRKELIPYEGVLGGTMAFYEIYILAPEMIFATFEDGHIGGNMLLKYKALNNCKIAWKPIDYYLGGPKDNRDDPWKLTVEDIKILYSDQKILNIHEFNGHYVLVESKREKSANKFELYNLITGDVDELPTGANFVSLEKIVSENEIILNATGRDSESDYIRLPYVISCIRDKENIDSAFDFKEVISEK